MIIAIEQTGRCWICGRDDQKMTSHHALPKHLHPVNNVVIPTCEDCHKRLNIEDLNGMYSYLYRIQKKIGENSQMIKKSFINLDALKKIKEEKIESTQ